MDTYKIGKWGLKYSVQTKTTTKICITKFELQEMTLILTPIRTHLGIDSHAPHDLKDCGWLW